MNDIRDTWRMLKSRGYFKSFFDYNEWSHKDDTPEERAEYEKSKVEDEHKEDFGRFKSDLSEGEQKDFNKMFEQ